MIKVIIERRIKPGMEEEFHQISSQLRATSAFNPGYLDGETWISKDDPNLSLSITTWPDRHTWECRAQSPDGKAVAAHVAPLLTEPARAMVFEVSEGDPVHWDAQLPYDISAPVL